MIVSVEVEEVKREVPTFDFPRLQAKLPVPTVLSWLRTRSFDSNDVVSEIAEQVPVGRDVVEWMHECAAINAAFDVVAKSYESAGGRVAWGSNDAYIPGVRVEDCYFASVPASTYRVQGATVVTPVGNYTFPYMGKVTVADRNVLAFATAGSAYDVQWSGAIMRWTSLARASRAQAVTDVPFAIVMRATAPQFFAVDPPLGVRHVDYVTLSSERPQEILVNLRSLSDYGDVLAGLRVDLPEGTSTLRLRVIGMGSYLLELQPQDGVKTYLESLAVRRV